MRCHELLIWAKPSQSIERVLALGAGPSTGRSSSVHRPSSSSIIHLFPARLFVIRSVNRQRQPSDQLPTTSNDPAITINEVTKSKIKNQSY
jgi:hypothetical protein